MLESESESEAEESGSGLTAWGEVAEVGSPDAASAPSSESARSTAGNSSPERLEEGLE